MAKPTDLVTLEAFKEALNVQGTADDNWIKSIISRTSAWIEQVTNRKLVARRYGSSFADAKAVHPDTLVPDEDYWYFDGDGGYRLKDSLGFGLYYLPPYPIQSNSVVPFELALLTNRDQSGETWDTTQLVENRDYIVDRLTGAIRLLGGVFHVGTRNYRVKCAAGFDLPAGRSGCALCSRRPTAIVHRNGVAHLPRQEKSLGREYRHMGQKIRHDQGRSLHCLRSGGVFPFRLLA